MANRYANLVGSNKIKDEYTKINIGFDKVEEEIDAHVGAGGNAHATATTSSAGFMSAADKQKLDGIETGAQVNQNAFAKVNDVEAADPSDELTITGGTGITITTNPNTKEVIVTATGQSTPGPHGSSHTEHGADPIPNATTTEGGLMSAADKTRLDGATSAATPNTLVQRDPAGRFKAAAPSASDDVARKAEVDAAQQAAINYAKQYGLGANTPYVADLNSLGVASDTGFYMTTGETLNLPPGVGDSSVIHIGRDARPSQLLLDHLNGRIFYRGYLGGSGWYGWKPIQLGQEEYDLPLAAGMVNLKTVLSSHDCKIYRVGNLAILVFALTKSSGNFTTGETIATLPSGLRPPVVMTILGRMIYVTNPTNTVGTYLGACEVNVGTNGNVVVYPADLQGNRVMGTAAYPIA